MGQDSGFGSQDSGDGGTTNDTFRIDRLTLKNFRCFEDKTIDFHPRFNVLIGDNGSGKTAVLDALAPGLGLIASTLQGVGRRRQPLGDEDARRTTHEALDSGHIDVEPQYPCGLAWTVTLGHQVATPSAEMRGERHYDTRKYRLDSVTGSIREAVASGRGALPLIAYYDARRSWGRPVVKVTDLRKPGPRVDGYDNCLRPTLGTGPFIEWLKTMELIALQEGRDVPTLAAVRSAIVDCTMGAVGVTYSIRHGQLRVELEDGRVLPFGMLSHGVTDMLASAGDMAWRCAVLNPHFGADAAKLTPGVVLIDEIDLHLHPKWQRHVVDDLKRAFPKVQFIVTTHSPFIIQSLEPGELIQLDAAPGGEHVDAEEYVERSIEEVADLVQGVDGRMSREREEMFRVAEEYYKALQEGKQANPERQRQLKQQLDELEAPYMGNVAYHAFLRMERIAAGLGDED